MIIINGKVWPKGDATRSYEVLHVSITNVEELSKEHSRYTAHVLSRPAPFDGIPGYEADIEVKEHLHANGLTPLLMAVLNAAAGPSGLILPPARTLARVDLVDAQAFQAAQRGRGHG